MNTNGFGDTSKSSLRRVVTELFQAPEVIAEMGKNRQLILTTLRADGFDETQMAVISDMLDSVLRLMIDLIVQLAGRLRVIPMQETSGVTGILAQMMKEASHAIDTRNNRLRKTAN